MNAESQQPANPGLKTRLVEVATELLARPRDMKLPTMRAIAKSAGVAPGAAYRHFDSQDELFLAVVTNLFGQLEVSIEKAVQSAQSAEEAIISTCLANATWGMQHTGGSQHLFETTDDMNLQATAQRPGVHLIDQLAVLLATPDLPTADDYVRATRLWTSVHGVVSLRIHKLGMTWPVALDSEIISLVRVILAK